MVTQVSELLLVDELESEDEILIHRGQDVMPVRTRLRGATRNTVQVDLPAQARVSNHAHGNADGIHLTLQPLPEQLTELSGQIVAENDVFVSSGGFRYNWVPGARVRRTQYDGDLSELTASTGYIYYNIQLRLFEIALNNGIVLSVNDFDADLLAPDVQFAVTSISSQGDWEFGGSDRAIFSNEEALREFISIHRNLIQDRVDQGQTRILYVSEDDEEIYTAVIEHVGSVAGFTTDEEDVRFSIASARATEDSDLRIGDDNGAGNILRGWYDPRVITSFFDTPDGANTGFPPVPDLRVFYSDHEQRTGYPVLVEVYTDVNNGLEIQDEWSFNNTHGWFHERITWASHLDVADSRTAFWGGGTQPNTGRFASDEELIEYINTHFDVFKARYDNGQYQIAYFNTVAQEVRIVTLNPFHYPEEANDWSVHGIQRDIGVAAVPAQNPQLSGRRVSNDSDVDGTWDTRGPVDRWANPRLQSSGQDAPAGIVNLMYRTDTERLQIWDEDGGNYPFLDSQIWEDSITWADARADSFGSGKYMAGSGRFLNQDALLVYVVNNRDAFDTYHAEGKTNLAYFDTTDNNIYIVAYTPSVPAVDRVDPEPFSVEVDEYAQRINVRYSPTADGAITDADTVGEIIDAINAHERGLSAETFGNAMTADEFDRAVGWAIDFGGSISVVIELNGYALGPAQNIFTGADEAAAIAARDAYATANPAWFQAYENNQSLFVVTRWGNAGAAKAWLVDTAGDWREVTFAFKGDKGDKGDKGEKGDKGDDGSILGEIMAALAAQQAAEAAQAAAEAAQTAAENARDQADQDRQDAQAAAATTTTNARDAQQAANAASTSEQAASASAGDALSRAQSASTSEINAENSATEAATSASEAATSAASAAASAMAAMQSEDGTEILFFNRDPVAADGENDDVAWNTIAGTIWKKLAGVWELQYTIGQSGGTGDHTRYFGMSLDRVIETADFANANTSQTNAGSFPANTVNSYPWFAVPENIGAPTGLRRPPNPINQITAYTRQAGTVDDSNGDPHIVFVANSQVPPNTSERNVELDY